MFNFSSDTIQDDANRYLDLLNQSLYPVKDSCPACSLTFEEFKQIGVTGCAHCYLAFFGAIQSALSVLNDPQVTTNVESL